MVRIAEGKYLIGTDSKQVLIKNTTCVVRVGGGFQNLEEYITRSEQFELEKIKKLMKDGDKSYPAVIKDLLNKYKTD